MNNSIKKISQVFVGSAIALSTLSVQPVMAASLYNQIFIFGDSLVDGGNLFNLTEGLVPPSGFSNGRFSNGDVWSGYLAQDLGLNPELWIKSPTEQITFIPNDGINFAIGGAKTDNTHITYDPDDPDDPQLPGLQQQVDYFIGLLGEKALDNPHALGVLMAGANDYFSLQLDPRIPVGNLKGEIEKLSDAGLKNILVSNLPDLGKTPLALSLGEKVSTGITTLTIAHNNLLKDALKDLSQSKPDVNLIPFDFYTLFNDILTNPSEFGFDNVADSCTNINLTTGVLEPEHLYQDNDLYQCSAELQNQFLFFDNQHPNTVAHRFIADEALRTVSTPEPAIIPALGFLGMGLLTNSISKRRLNKKKKKMVVAK